MPKISGDKVWSSRVNEMTGQFRFYFWICRSRMALILDERAAMVSAFAALLAATEPFPACSEVLQLVIFFDGYAVCCKAGVFSLSGHDGYLCPAAISFTARK